MSQRDDPPLSVYDEGRELVEVPHLWKDVRGEDLPKYECHWCEIFGSFPVLAQLPLAHSSGECSPRSVESVYYQVSHVTIIRDSKYFSYVARWR